MDRCPRPGAARADQEAPGAGHHRDRDHPEGPHDLRAQARACSRGVGGATGVDLPPTPGHHLFERDARLPDVAQAVPRVALEATTEQAAQGRRGFGREAAPVGLLPEHASQHVGDHLALEQRPSGQHLEQDDSERPDVGPLVDRLAARLLGSHVGRRAEQDARLGVVLSDRRGERRAARDALALPRLGEPEVEHLDRAVGPDADVGGLEVAVDDAGLVGRFQRLRDLQGDGDRLVDRHRPPSDHLVEPLALDKLHDQDVALVEVLEGVQGGDVRVVEGGEHPCLALEAGEALGVQGEVLGQQFERYVAAELRVGGAPHLPHPALAELGGDLVWTEAGAVHRSPLMAWTPASSSW